MIKILPAEVAHKIAAGEVIERPASVVKELVENSIDAYASQIVIEVRKGGIEFIRVQDNGIGIPADELELAFQPHATSKIEVAEDLFSLRSLGFRGEALPSIASIAQVTLTSRPTKQEHGFKISQKEGEGFLVEPIGSPEGTVVEVRNLFYNVPARFKFLKTPAAENRRVVEMATNLALAHPHIAFRLVADGKSVLSTPGNGRLLDTILVIQGSNISRDVIKFSAKFAWGSVLGYLGSPRLAKGNRSGQTFIMNGRVIQSTTLQSALEKAYRGLLQGRLFPWAVVVMAVDPKLVDCNVHPAKVEVRFANEQELFGDVFSAIRSGLSEKDLAPSLEKPAPKKTPRPKPALQAQLEWEPASWQHMDSLLRQYKPRPKPMPTYLKPQPEPAKVSEKEMPQPPEGLAEIRRQLLSARLIGQLHQTYLLLEVATGLWILDQHIVHERILYEKLKKDYKDAKIHVQSILPQVLEFTPAEASLIEDSLAELAGLGLELEIFGQNSFLLRSVPSILAETSAKWQAEILEIAERPGRQTPAWQEEAVISLACIGAIKAGEYLDKAVIKTLLEDLAATENPFTCPHGRPIIVKLEDKELRRRFGRS